MNLNKREWIIIGTAIALLLIIIMTNYLRPSSSIEDGTMDWLQVSTEEEISEELESVNETAVIVDVKGAVVAPGVYELNGGTRIIDAIRLAGGLTSDADETKVNLAALLEDEMVVYIPKFGEVETEEPMFTAVSAQGQKSKDDGKVAINQASSAELETLPGIGPARAAAIISYREQHGPFKTVEDLLNISGIGPKSLEKLKEHVMIK